MPLNNAPGMDGLRDACSDPIRAGL